MVRFAVLSMALVLGASAPVVAAEPTKSHKDAAEALLVAMSLDKQLDAAIDVMLAQQVKANPQLAQFKDVMKAFFKKHMSYESLKPDLIKMYAESFTEAELKDLVAFYKTPTGKKLIEKQPSLMQKGAELGASKVQENLPELRRMIEEAAKKNN